MVEAGKLDAEYLIRADYTECHLCESPMSEAEEKDAYFIHVSMDNEILHKNEETQKETMGWYPIGKSCGCCAYIPSTHKTK